MFDISHEFIFDQHQFALMVQEESNRIKIKKNEFLLLRILLDEFVRVAFQLLVKIQVEQELEE